MASMALPPWLQRLAATTNVRSSPTARFKTETYAFGSGGNWGGDIKDATIDKLNFLDVAKVIAGPLASQKYLPAKDPNNTKLLIMVYWGTTTVPPRYRMM